MPNYITNILHIKAEPEILNKILPKDTKFSFAHTVPPPKDNDTPVMSLTDQRSKWFVDNWGTKWDAVRPCIRSQTDTELILVFDTAWSPPDKWLEHIHTMFPTLEFNVVWADEDFPKSGYIILKDNKIITKQYRHDEPEAYEFVKTHFPEWYEKEMKYNRLHEITKKISPELTRIFRHLDELILNFKECRVYMSSDDGIMVSVEQKYRHGQRNVINKLSNDIKLSLLERTVELLEKERVHCKIKDGWYIKVL